MNDLYDKICAMCTIRHITPSKLCSDLGWGKSTISDLKYGRSKSLSSKKVTELCQYFGISADYLINSEIAPTKSESIKNEIQQKESAKATKVKRMLESASDEELDFIIRFLKLRGK